MTVGAIFWRFFGSAGVFAAAEDAVLVFGIEPPVDVYDTATYMAVSVLSEQSTAAGGMPVAFPDFTEGKYLERELQPDTPYRPDICRTE